MPWPPDAYPSPLVAMAAARPHHLALRHAADSLSYERWARKSCALATWLEKQDVAVGDVVCVVGTGTTAHAVALFSLLERGAVMAPLSASEPAEALRARVAAIAPRFVWLPLDAPPAIAAVFDALGIERLPLCIAQACAQAAADNTPTTASALSRAPWRLTAPWAVLCTSGSTGAPRAISLCGRQIVGNAFAVANRLGNAPSDVWLSALPWHHVGGLMVLFRAVLLGTAAHLCQPFDAAHAARLLDDNCISLAPLVPTMLTKILDARPARPMPARVRAIILGGAATSGSLFERARALSLPIAVSWGMTETASQVATAIPYQHSTPADVGAPLVGAHIDVAPGGALRVQGVMAGGTWETRDHGTIDDAGHVHVGGRLDDVLISGGENVPVEPIEALLCTHPAIGDAAVVGVKDEMWGERPVAFVVLAAHAVAETERPSEAALVAFCRERMASFQRPMQFVWQPALPRDALGKLRRHVLRAMLAGAPR